MHRTMAVINQIPLILVVLFLNAVIIQCRSKIKAPRVSSETGDLPSARDGEGQTSYNEVDDSAIRVDYGLVADERNNDDPSAKNESGIAAAKREDEDSTAEREAIDPSAKRHIDSLPAKRSVDSTDESNGTNVTIPAAGENHSDVFQCTDADIDKESKDQEYQYYCYDMFRENCKCTIGDTIDSLEECIIREAFDYNMEWQLKIEKKRKEVFEKRGQEVIGGSKAEKCKTMGDAIKTNETKKGCIEAMKCVRTMWWAYISYPPTDANRTKLGENLPHVVHCMEKNMGQCKGNIAFRPKHLLNEFKTLLNYSEGNFECNDQDELEGGFIQIYCENAVDRDCNCHMSSGKVLTMDECKDDFMDMINLQLEIERLRDAVMKQRGHDVTQYLTNSTTLECQKQGKAKGYKEREDDKGKRTINANAKGPEASLLVLTSVILFLMALTGTRSSLVLTAALMCAWSGMCYLI